MNKKTYKINILAPKETIWEILWNKDTYEKWTEVFCPGSTIVADWKEGGKVHFLSSQNNGMYSVIERMIPYENMSFKHIGELSEGKESEKLWDDATECYFLKESGNTTELTVETALEDEYQEYFDENFPKALKIVKHLSEDQNPHLLRAKAAIQIQKPVEEVFEAIVNPEIMMNYFISYGSARMEAGKQVIWRFPEFEGDAPVKIHKIEENKYISFYWDIEDNELLTEIRLEPTNDNSTVIRITEKSMENNEAGIAWLIGNTEGWANFLACLKAWLEYGVHLRKGAFDFMKVQ